MRVLVVDGDLLVAESLASALRSTGIDVIGAVPSVDDAVRVVTEASVDVVLAAVMIGGEPAGLEIAARMREMRPDAPPVVLLSSFRTAYLVAQAREAGAVAYLRKDTDFATLRASLEDALAGRSSLPAPAGIELAPSEREIAIMRLVGEGRSSAEIGVRLGLTTRTIETYLSRMFERYGVSSRSQLVVTAISRAWITVLPGDDADVRGRS